MEKLPEDNYTGVNQAEPFPNVPLRYLTASSIIGDEVYDMNREKIGKIEEIMLDITNGKIDYVVVEFGGFLGIGIKAFAIPFRLLEVNAKEKTFVFRGDMNKLKDAPGFDLNHWPDTNFHKEEEYWHFV